MLCQVSIRGNSIEKYSKTGIVQQQLGIILIVNAARYWSGKIITSYIFTNNAHIHGCGIKFVNVIVAMLLGFLDAEIFRA
jgi:uncharacterized GH25 family protein